MRLFFAFLVLANLVLAFFGTDASRSAAPSADRGGDTGLTLIKELSPAERPRPRMAVTTADLPEDVRTAADESSTSVMPGLCHRIEGLTDAQALAAAKSRLIALGADVRRSGQVALEKRRYWVVLPRFRSRQQAESVMARLRAAGIKDFYFVASGEDKNTISLGLFSTPEAAQRRATQLGSLKLRTQTREVISHGRGFYLDVDTDEDLPVLREALRPLGVPELQIRACPDAG
ncbi:MAG: SPOR domain-containing protein [Gammaproteobacteria bacterium]|nr:SPOR domain-containing protein [Gammaproteobacteria bacterium]